MSRHPNLGIVLALQGCMCLNHAFSLSLRLGLGFRVQRDFVKSSAVLVLTDILYVTG